MRENEKTCAACAYSYTERTGFRLRQKCRSPEYNSQGYTGDMFMEDRERGFCRFWSPEIRDRTFL